MTAVDPVDDALGTARGQIRVERSAGIVTVRLDRPDKQNAVSYAMWTALARLLPVLASDDDVDVVVLKGTDGGPFSAGADIGEFRTLRADAEGARRYGAAVAAGEAALIAFPRPTVAVVQGYAMGGGSQLALACDLRLCDPSARFAIPPARLGIVYALPSTARLVETVGAAWARWILLTGDQVDAATALRIGLVHEVHPPEDLGPRVAELCTGLAARARVSLEGGKALVDLAVRGHDDEDEEVTAWYERSLLGPEYAEGVAAFLGKRAADFPAARHR